MPFLPFHLFPNVSSMDYTGIFRNAYDDEDLEEEVDMNNVISSYSVPDTSFTKFHKDHHEDQVIGSLKTPVQTRHMTKINEEHEPKKPVQALKDPSWVEAMQDELIQFKLLKMVAQEHIHEEGIDFDEVFAQFQGLKAIRYYGLCFFKEFFLVFQMDVKCAFLYGKIESEVLQVTPKTSHLNAVKRIFRYLKAKTNWAFGILEIHHLTWKLFLIVTMLELVLTGNPQQKVVNFLARDWFHGNETTTASTNADGKVELTATIDGQEKTITEASLRRHLKLEDSDGHTSLPNTEIFKQLALMGYMSDSDRLTFQKGYFSPQWRFLIHTILHCLKPTTLPHDSSQPRVQSLGSDEGSLTLNELMVLCTSLSNKVQSLETELKETKQTYNSALTQLIRRVKKLEQIVKASKSKRMARVVESNDEEDLEDPSKQGRSLIEELNMDAGISLVPLHAANEGRNDDTQIYDQPAEQLGVFSAATSLADTAKRRISVETTQTYTRRKRSVSTGSGGVSTTSRTVSTADVSTTSELGSTAGVKAKDKGKEIMQEFEPPKKVKKRIKVQMSMDEELAKKVFEEEQAKAMVKQEQERINFEAALELQKQLDEREEVVAEPTQAQKID
ncbi:xylulose kinase-1 [Tanacetum coccineum]